MNNIDRSILTFLAGAAVGAVAGILYAPEKGAVTRERLRRGAQELAAELEESLQEEADLRISGNRKQAMDTRADELPAV